MEKGLTEQSKQLRRHLLNHNAPDVMKWMLESGMADPVGMIVEMTDDIGKQLTYAALEKTRHATTRDSGTHRFILQRTHPDLQMLRQLRDRKADPSHHLRNRPPKPHRPTQTGRPLDCGRWWWR